MAIKFYCYAFNGLNLTKVNENIYTYMTPHKKVLIYTSPHKKVLIYT